LLKGVSTFYQWVIKGIVILIAVIMDELKRR
jgi:predicted ABC-type sugar transport system permease subunit